MNLKNCMEHKLINKQELKERELMFLKIVADGKKAFDVDGKTQESDDLKSRDYYQKILDRID